MKQIIEEELDGESYSCREASPIGPKPGASKGQAILIEQHQLERRVRRAAGHAGERVGDIEYPY